MAYEVVSSVVSHRGKIIEVVSDEITLPNGKTAQREVVNRGNATAIVPIDENGCVTMVRQYRHAAKGFVLEIPAGMVDTGEEFLTCAVRELEEETGLIAGKIVKLLDFYPSVGFCSEIIALFLATGLSLGKQSFDEDEFIELEHFSLDELTDKIANGEIVDSKTIIGVLAAREYLARAKCVE